MNIKKILITGITGFAGIHLTKELLNSSKKIYGTYYPENTSKLFKKLYPDIKINLCNIQQKTQIKKVLEKTKPDLIYHLAAISSVGYSMKNFNTTYTTNTIGTINLLKSCVELNINPKIIFISSADVYGNINKKFPLTETSKTDARSPYAYSKIAAENAVNFFSDYYNLDCVILRPFSHTGPYQSSNFVFPSFVTQINKIKKGELKPIIKVGNLNIERDYLDVRDVIRAYKTIGFNDCKNKIYNISANKNYTIRDLLDILLKIAKLKNEITIKVQDSLFRKADIPKLTGSYNLINKEFGWKPKYKIESTFKKMLTFYK